jgi:hypothetical protein
MLGDGSHTENLGFGLREVDLGDVLAHEKSLKSSTEVLQVPRRKCLRKSLYRDLRLRRAILATVLRERKRLLTQLLSREESLSLHEADIVSVKKDPEGLPGCEERLVHGPLRDIQELADSLARQVGLLQKNPNDVQVVADLLTSELLSLKRVIDLGHISVHAGIGCGHDFS